MPQTVIAHNIVALYSEPNTNSPLTSQLVLGTRVRILGEAVDNAPGAQSTGMLHVESEDRYQGWLRGGYVASEQESLGDNPDTTIATLIADIHSSPGGDSQIFTKLTVATRVILDRHDSGRDFLPLILPTGETGYTHRANLSSSYRSNDNDPSGGLGDLDTQLPNAGLLAKLRAQIVPRLVEHAAESSLRFIGTPYLWGGTTPFGLDCSGLTQLCYKIAGIQLLRDAWMQMLDKRFTLVEREALMADALYKPGDLLFFHSSLPAGEGSLRRIAHVGIALGDGSFVHAAGQGRGVLNTRCDDPEWTAIYAGAARLSPDTDLSVQSA